jgi:acyl-CoA synthetase (AMP-forming)/AMP-acid ligase II
MAMPDSPAIIFAARDDNERIVTFGEIDDRSTQLVRVLAGEGLTVGDFVDVFTPNGPEHLIASFAGGKVGTVVIPKKGREPRARRPNGWSVDRLCDC